MRTTGTTPSLDSTVLSVLAVNFEMGFFEAGYRIMRVLAFSTS